MIALLVWLVSGAFVFGAAVCFDTVARALIRPRRFIWSAAMLAIAMMPIVGPRLTFLASLPAPTANAIAQRLPLINVGASPMTPATDTTTRRLALAWLALSALMVARHLMALRRLAAMRRGWSRRVVDGVPLEVSEKTGPAIVGLRSPAIVVPAWFESLPDEERALVLAHERQHLIAHDHQLLSVSRALTMLVPWHPFVWMAARRLSLAVEQDCDARVLAAGASPVTYATTLVNVAHRARMRREALVPALLEPTSSLSRRITTMFAPRARFPRVVTAVAATAGTSLLVIGCMTREPLDARPVQSREPVVVTAIQSPSTAGGDSVFLEYQVQQPVRPAPGGKPPYYPDSLRAAGVQGEVLAEFIVDKNGKADMSSWKVLKSTNEQFANAVHAALPFLQYTPAQRDGRIVRQLVQQPFAFFIATP